MLIILFVLHCQRTFLASFCWFCLIHSDWTRLVYNSLAPCNFCLTLQLCSFTVVSLSFHQLRCKKGNLGRWEDMEWEVRMRKFSSKSFACFLPCHAALYKSSLSWPWQARLLSPQRIMDDISTKQWSCCLILSAHINFIIFNNHKLKISINWHDLPSKDELNNCS